MVVTRSSKQKGNNDGIPGQKGLSVGLQKLLFSEIERTGGIETYYNEQGQKKQKLQDLLDSNAVRPYFPSEIEQEQAKSCVKYWRTLKKTGQYDKLYTRFREPLPTSPTAGGS